VTCDTHHTYSRRQAPGPRPAATPPPPPRRPPVAVALAFFSCDARARTSSPRPARGCCCCCCWLWPAHLRLAGPRPRKKQIQRACRAVVLSSVVWLVAAAGGGGCWLVAGGSWRVGCADWGGATQLLSTQSQPQLVARRAVEQYLIAHRATPAALQGPHSQSCTGARFPRPSHVALLGCQLGSFYAV
jgi:hypothetical protein